MSPGASAVAMSFLGSLASSLTSETIFQVLVLLASLIFQPDMSLLISGLPPSAASSAARARWMKMLRATTTMIERNLLVRMGGDCSEMGRSRRNLRDRGFAARPPDTGGR